jgi:peptide/nickel transport system permease protein
MAQPTRGLTTNELHLHGLAHEESKFRVLWRRFARNRAAFLGLIIIGLLVLMAIFAPLIAPEKWDFLDILSKNQAPSAKHWFGTDFYGRDLFSRILWGSRISLSVGFVAAGVSVTIGTVWGAIAGYYAGSWLDVTMMRIAEAISAIPFLVLLIVVASVISRSVYTTMLVIGLTSWPGMSFLVRGQYLSLRKWDFVQAAEALGANDRRIIFKHILPHVFTVILVQTSFRVGGAILAESTLNFLGFGAPPPFPTWGEALSTGRQVMRIAWWATTIPGIFITMTVLAFNLVGNGLRDALDPKQKR